MPSLRQPFLIAVFAVTMLATGCSLPGFGGGSEKKVEGEEVSFLMVMWAPEGSLQPADAKGRELVLILKAPATTATFYSDRPKRLAGQVPLGLLADSWPKMGLADNPPIVAVVVNQGEPDERSITGEVSDPKWDPDAQTMSFILRSTAPPTGGIPAFVPPAGDGDLPESFRQVTLLIDPSDYRGVEYLVTGAGVVALRETYATNGKHPIDVLPRVTYIGPDYFGRTAQTDEKPMVALRR